MAPLPIIVLLPLITTVRFKNFFTQAVFSTSSFLSHEATFSFNVFILFCFYIVLDSFLITVKMEK